MSFRKAAMSALAAASMIALPSMATAQTASASKLSVAGARAGAHVKGENLGGSSLIIALLAGAAIVAGIVVAADSNSRPNSP